MTVALGPKGSNLVLGGKLSEVSAEEAYTVRTPGKPLPPAPSSHAVLTVAHHSYLRPWCDLRLSKPRPHGAEKVCQVRPLDRQLQGICRNDRR